MGMFRELALLRLRHGHARAGDGAAALGRWLRAQARKGQRGVLDGRRRRLLRGMGAACGDPPDYKAWDGHWLELLSFRCRHGHSSVPQLRAGPGWALGHWVMRQRQKGLAGELSVYQVARLDAAGFVWSSHGDRWGARFNELLRFAQRAGHCNVPKRPGSTPRGLHWWVTHQRREAKKGTLPPDRRQRLEGLGFTWDVLRDGAQAGNRVWRIHEGMFHRAAGGKAPMYAAEDGVVHRSAEGAAAVSTTPGGGPGRPPGGGGGAAAWPCFESEGLLLDVPPPGGESARALLERAGRGEFDGDLVSLAVERGALTRREAGEWGALYRA